MFANDQKVNVVPMVTESPIEEAQSEADEDIQSQASSEYKPQQKRRAAKAARKRFHEEEFQSESEAGEAPKKRGRKKQKDEDYITGANQKIEALREEYKKAQKSGATAAQKKRLRNQITAMQSRVK